jgi:hypothetical protein
VRERVVLGEEPARAEEAEHHGRDHASTATTNDEAPTAIIFAMSDSRPDREQQEQHADLGEQVEAG